MDTFESFNDLFSWSEPILITTSKGGFYYNLFYFLAFLLATAWLIGEGYKRKFHLFTWIIVLAFTRIFFIIGSKVISYSTTDWQYVLHNFELIPTSSKVVLGGVFLGTIAVLLLMRILNLPLKTLDAFAYVLPISLAVQRMGCFLLGCCYGLPTDLPIGVSYGYGTLPHFHQYQTGVIEAFNLYSLPVHPFQLYEVLNGIMVVVILCQYRKKLRAAGSFLSLSIGLSVIFRFFLEFIRDPNAHAMGGNLIGGIKVMQWLLLFTALIAFCFLIYNEKRSTFKIKKPSPSTVYPARLVGLLLVSVVITWSLRNWFLPVELLVLNIILFPAIIMALVHLFQTSAYPQYKWLTISLMIIPVFLMSQTWKLNENESPDSTHHKSFDTFRTGFSAGKYFTSVRGTMNQGDGCTDIGDYEDFENVYWNLAAGYSRTKFKKKGELTYGADIMSGKYREKSLDNTITNNHQLYSIYPYVRYQEKWFGVGAGVYLGQMYWADPYIEITDGSAITTSTVKSNIYPSLYGRIGPERIFFIDGGLANAFPSPFPGMRYEMAVGSGFGLPDGNRFRVGSSPFGTFIQAEILPHQNFLFAGSYVWGRSNVYDNRNRQFLFGLQYRFNHK
ncbi:MAG TPA: prolipoprotein diacylglyceryl transferase family protein [Anditalea sp.]|nr:prolipoprotein diacylglyceryl transferase family protein [Anditalea sp.]